MFLGDSRAYFLCICVSASRGHCSEMSRERKTRAERTAGWLAGALALSQRLGDNGSGKPSSALLDGAVPAMT